jgi:hypothetical protein
MVDLARWLRRNVVEINGELVEGRPHSLRKVAAELADHGYCGPGGVPYAAAAVASMLGK